MVARAAAIMRGRKRMKEDLPGMFSMRNAIAAAALVALLPPLSVVRTCAAAENSIKVAAGDLSAVITLSADHAAPGQELGVTADFTLGPGWHVYGEPLPEGYIATRVKFADDLIAAQSMNFPKAAPVEFAAIGEKLPAYKDRFRASGRIRLRPAIKPGPAALKGTLQFQECNDQICKLPKTVEFEVPLKID
jgi:DsbC/DsbD-like thiol-disulfide interchange protein